MKIEYQPIGILRTPFKTLKEIPKQPPTANGAQGILEVYLEFQEGLKDLEGFSHILVLCHFHKSTNFALTLVPAKGTKVRGVFATRSPRRPNPIGVSVLQLDGIQGNKLMVSNLDILDGTPVLDIKPYFPVNTSAKEIRTGWISG